MRRLIVLTLLLLAAGGGVYWWGWVRVPLKEETRNFRGLPIPVVVAVATWAKQP